MLYREVDQKRYTTQLPRINEQVQWLWVTDYCDAPLAGVVEIAGRRYWAKMYEENPEDRGWYRRYLVIDLADEQWAEEDRWHALFQRHVGTHWDYVADKRPSDHSERVKPLSEWHHFYDAWAQCPPMDLSNNPVYGWFEH